MAKYRITDQVSGKTLVINGDKPPSEQEAEDLFNQSGIRDQQTPQVQPQAQPNPLQQIGNTMAPVSNFLMPNAVKYAQNSLQEIGAGNLSPGAITSTNRVLPEVTSQQKIMDLLMAAMGPGAQQVAGVAGIGSPLENQKNMGAREVAQTLQLAKGAASGIQGAINKTGETVSNIVGAKSLNPWKVTGYARDKAINAAGELNTSKVIEAGEKYVSNDPLAKDVWETVKPTLKETTSAKDLIYKMSKVWGQAYDKSGDVRNKAAAQLFNELYSAGKEVLKTQAPDIAKNNVLFKMLYDAPKTVQKATWLALKTTAIGKMLMP